MESTSASTSSSTAALGVRKRVDSTSDESFLSVVRSKRPRLSAMAMPSSYGQPSSIGFGTDRLQGPLSIFDDPDDLGNTSTLLYSPTRHTRPLSGSSSFTAGSRSGSPFFTGDLNAPPPGSIRIGRSVALMRSVSSSSLRSSELIIPVVYPESSAKHWLRNTRTTIDYSMPTGPDEISARVLSCSTSNVAYFTRGNRVHFKNLTTNYNEDIGQLCKLSASQGNIRAMELNGKYQSDNLAIGTSKGFIQIWDVQAKKITMTWPTTKEISAMAWSGPVLTVGGAKGTIRHYDTRIHPVSKLREQARKVTRHQCQITALSWNEDGKYLASGDSMGNVFCWEQGQVIPLNVGEFVQRRKKIHQSGKISAVSWAPWQPKLLATGDARGLLRLWNINEREPQSNAVTPGKLDTGSVITGVHFSPQCKEILTAHGARIGDPPQIDSYNLPKPSLENALAIHSYPTLRHVSTFRLPLENAIGDSVLNGVGTKVIFATPAEGKINVCDVWSKRKEVKRQASFMSTTSSTASLIR